MDFLFLRFSFDWELFFSEMDLNYVLRLEMCLLPVLVGLGLGQLIAPLNSSAHLGVQNFDFLSSFACFPAKLADSRLENQV